MSHFPIDFDLPPELIAQAPMTPRDHSRLLVLADDLQHRRFHDLPDLLAPGDLLVLNDTRVLNARLVGKRKATGGKWEGLFLKEQRPGIWEMLCQTGGRPKPGEVVVVEPNGLEVALEEKLATGGWLVRPLAEGSPREILERHGQTPLPPYIRGGRGGPDDVARYQTVYAAKPGAVAAPTAGLHFTVDLFDRLRRRDIAAAFVTLHVGLGTFQPIQVDDYTRHPMHAEWGELGPETVVAIDACRRRGGRVVAVGTTPVRVLETAAANAGDRLALAPWSGDTRLYIHPPYRPRVVQGLITNFHLPRTTLLLLVAAFGGIDRVQAAYDEAIRERYRFYSYGDAMLILK